ncbi:5240_t:CDS:2 [Cetraspora pellucida]|uniref:5240_t:CDS:1 n=1 Tax=Cetraspora pellucida TaxID=1433469 RepID=A0A9N9H461_9GLOM|nr:5240_t:CDS:2 [Cetraspora pellucida]
MRKHRCIVIYLMNHANSDSEEELESNIIVSSSSKASSKVSSKTPFKKHISNKKQKIRKKHPPGIDNNEVIYATDVQNKASLLDNNELDELLNKLPIEDNHAATLITLIQNKERDDTENSSDNSDEEPFKVPIQEAHNALKT